MTQISLKRTSWVAAVTVRYGPKAVDYLLNSTVSFADLADMHHSYAVVFSKTWLRQIVIEDHFK